MTLNEAQTRFQQIDPQLRAADWKLNDRTQVRLEVPVDGYDAEPWNGVTDYCLYEASATCSPSWKPSAALGMRVGTKATSCAGR